MVTLLVLVAGCSAPPPREAHRRVEPTDPCAMRLHDISGHVLLFYATQGKLPAKLEDLAAEKSGDPLPPFECPVTKARYKYDRNGLDAPGQPGRVVLADAVPAHAGFRWGVVIEEPGPGKPLVTRVVALVGEMPPAAAPAK